MNDTERTQNGEPLASGDEDQEHDSASLEGRGWDILAGGETHAAEMGGSDPFDARLPEDREADEVLRLGVEGQTVNATPTPIVARPSGSEAVYPQAVSPGVTIDLMGETGPISPAGSPSDESRVEASPSPQGMSPGVSVDLLGEQRSGEVPPGAEPISPGVSVEVLDHASDGEELAGEASFPLSDHAEPPVEEPLPLNDYAEPVTSVQPISPGVTVEVLDYESAGAELEGEDPIPLGGYAEPPLEAPPLSIEELTRPPRDVPAHETDAGAAPQEPASETVEPFAPFSSTAGAEPFASGYDTAPFGSEPGEGVPETVIPPESIPTLPAAPWEEVSPEDELPVSQDFDLARSRPYDPFEEELRPPRSLTDDLPPHQDLETLLITKERINALWDEINETYNLVISDVRGYYSATDSAIHDLKRARELLLAGYEHFDNAEELVKRVKARLRLEEKVRQWSRTRGTWLGIYLVIWLLLLLAVVPLTASRVAGSATDLGPAWMAATFLPGLFGGLGAVVGALWVLIKHIAKKRDFDPIHTPWYVTNPFMGIALGVVTYLLVRVGDVLLTGDTLLPASGELGTMGLYALCIFVGFNQNVLWALADRVFKAILPADTTRATVDEVTAGETES